MTGAYERVLSSSAVFVDPGWFPEAADCEELADLREEHTRLLEACGKALKRIAAEESKYERAVEKRHEAMRKAIAEGKNANRITTPEPDDSAVREARQVYEAACQVLQEFVVSAQAEIRARAPQVQRHTDLFLRSAQEKRAEAKRLLRDADELEARPKKLNNWLARYTGESALGPIAFETLEAPIRVPVPDLFEELAGLPPATVVEIGSDEISDVEMEAIQSAK